MKRQRVENNKLTSHGRRCYRTLDPGRGEVRIGGDCREWQLFFYCFAASATSVSVLKTGLWRSLQIGGAGN